MPKSRQINWTKPVSSHRLNDGLVSWWLARGPWTGGVIWRDLCGKNHGTLTGMDPKTDWVGSTRPGGKQALDFDGSDDLVLAPATVNAAPLTFTAWIRLTSLGVIRAIVTASTGDTGNDIFSLAVLNTDVLQMTSRTTSNGSANGPTTLTAGVWTFVAGVTASSTSRFAYINGVPGTESTTDRTPTASGINSTRIGLYDASIFPWLGQIDDVRVYNRALSHGEIYQLYSDSLSGYPLTLNRLSRRVGYVAAPPPSTNRRRRILIAGSR